MRQPTHIEAQQIHDILEKVQATENTITWNGTFDQAKDLSKALGYKLKFTSECHSCRLKLLNILREKAGLPGIGKKAPQTWQDARWETCQSCPAFHPNTKSCGRLFTDAFSPKSITIDGQEVKPCGCFLPLKIEFIHSECPANKWER